MTLVTIDIKNVASETHPDDRVVFYSPANRNEQGVIISTAMVEVPLVDGQASKELAPGPVVVRILARGVSDTRAKAGYVPDAESVSLIDVITDWLPPLVDQGVLAILAALEEALGDVKTSVAAEVAAIRWARGIAPANFNTLTTSGSWQVRSTAEATAITTHAGPLPTLVQGVLTLHYEDSGRAQLKFETRTGQIWSAGITTTTGGWSSWKRVDEGAAPRPYIGIVPADLDATTATGYYVARTWGESDSVTSAAGKLPELGAGVLRVIVEPNRVRSYQWHAISGKLWVAGWTQAAGWSAWREIGKAPTLAELGAAPLVHNHDGKYTTPAMLDSAKQELRDYTDTAFSAAAPGGATDEAVDAAIDRAIAQGKIAEQVDLSELPLSESEDATAALASIVTSGVKRIVLPPSARLKISSTITIPPGVSIDGNGATIVQDFTTDNPALILSSGCQLIGTLTVETKEGGSRGVSAVGDRISIDSLHIICATGGAGAGVLRAHGFLATGSHITVRDLLIDGHDNACGVLEASDVKISSLTVRRYVRGVWIKDANDIFIRGTIRVASVNAQILPGHNGVLIEAGTISPTSNVHLDVSIADSGEHGIRMSGEVSHIILDHVSIKNVGGSGVKILGDAERVGGTGRARDISITSPTIVGSGAGGTVNAGILVHYAEDVSIISPRIYSQGTYSSSIGIELQGVNGVLVSNASITATFAGMWVRGIRGDVKNVQITGGKITSPQGVFFERGADANVRYSDFRIADIDLSGCTTALGISSGSSLIGPSMSLQASVGSALISGDTSNFFLNVDGVLQSDAVAARGSMWRTSDGIYMRGASWNLMQWAA